MASLPYRIEARRLALVCPDPSLAPLRLQAITRNLERLASFLRLTAPPSLDEVASDLARRRASFDQGSDALYAVTTLDGEHYAGDVFVLVRAGHDAREVGYMMFEPFAGRGFATEAARAVIFAAFRALSLTRFDLQYAIGNAASGRVAEKLGFTREGVLRGRTVPSDPRPTDSAMCSLLREDFEVRARAWPKPRALDALGRPIDLGSP